MSRTTNEINRITTTVISLSAKILFAALVIFLLYEGATRGYALGYEVFNPVAAEAAPGRDVEFSVGEGEGLFTVAGRLEEAGLIESRLVFVAQAVLYEYEIYPGTYVLNSSETSRELLQKMDEAAAETARQEAEEEDDGQ